MSQALPTDAQDLQGMPWRGEELRSVEEGMPRLIEGHVEKAARSCKAETGVGGDGFHPKVLLDLSEESRVVLFDPKNVTSERPIALLPTMICR